MLGQTEILEDIQGLIQSRVGTFLQLRSQLQEMSRSPVLTISDEAIQLLLTQDRLETDLPGAIEKSKSDNFSDLISASGFFILVEKQIHDVSGLHDEYIGLGSSAKASLFGGIPDWILWVGGGVFILSKMMKKRRKK